MSCIHYHTYSDNYYSLSEAFCDYENTDNIDIDSYDCESCPYYYSEEDYENDLADYKCDTYRDFL